ncbi:hypothetical protein [Streptomyces sp. 2-1]|uniref:hypothetical protein n=1 Tax=Streptomyces sp. 2-1 TaxID=412710 RepID=UPI003AFB4A4D
MVSDLRRAVVVTLGALGRRDDWRDRADAGHSLAEFAEMPEAVEPLLGLVLDRGDTFVARRTAEGLLRRKDRVGLTIVASALAVANDNHADYIHVAIVDVSASSQTIWTKRCGSARRCRATPTIVLPGGPVGCTKAWQRSIPFSAPHSRGRSMS